MGKQSWAKAEREAVANELELVGPDAPTLCGDWTTRDLAAHLVVREKRPDAAVGIVFKPLAGWGEKVQAGEAESASWNSLVDAIRNGPPLLSGFSLPGADSILNTTEYYVHLEDIRRAQPSWSAREIDPLFSESLWKILKTRGAGFFRHSPVGILLKRTDGRGGQVMAHPGKTRVTISGPAQELLLYAFGRKDHALVEIEGSDADKAGLAGADMSV